MEGLSGLLSARPSSRCFHLADLEASQIRHSALQSFLLPQMCNSCVRCISKRYRHPTRPEPDRKISLIPSKTAPCPAPHCPSPPKLLYLGGFYSTSRLWSQNLCIQQTFSEPEILMKHPPLLASSVAWAPPAISYLRLCWNWTASLLISSLHSSPEGRGQFEGSLTV